MPSKLPEDFEAPPRSPTAHLPRRRPKGWATGRMPLAAVEMFGTAVVRTHEANPLFGTAQALDSDLDKVLDGYDYLTDVERKAVRLYVRARLRLVDRLKPPPVYRKSGGGTTMSRAEVKRSYAEENPLVD